MYILDKKSLLINRLIGWTVRFNSWLLKKRQLAYEHKNKELDNNIETMEDLLLEFESMSKEELTKILYIQTNNMKYKDMRANKIKFLRVDENYYVNYELIFFNILQIVQPSYKPFAIKYFNLIPERNSVSFDEGPVQKYYEALCTSYCISDSTEKRKYMKLSIKDFYFKVNLLKIPIEIVTDLKKKGVSFKDAISEKNYNYCRECKFFHMSYKYIILRDNVP